MSNQPNSQLTADRPDIWLRAIALATSVTGLEYVHKAPLPDGAIYACGGGGWYTPPPPTPQQIIIEKIDNIDRRIRDEEESLKYYKEDPEWCAFDLNKQRRKIDNLKRDRDGIARRGVPTPELDRQISDLEIPLPALERDYKEQRKNDIDGHKKKIEDLKKERAGLSLSPVPVPDGAMEWLLHEVGHWTASTTEERRLPNYGYGIVKDKGWGKDREWQAWAFEEIIMAPFGPSRGFAPVEHRGGTAFDGPGWQGIPERHLKHVYAQILASGISVEQWRALYGEWVLWGTEKGVYSPL